MQDVHIKKMSKNHKLLVMQGNQMKQCDDAISIVMSSMEQLMMMSSHCVHLTCLQHP